MSEAFLTLESIEYHLNNKRDNVGVFLAGAAPFSTFQHPGLEKREGPGCLPLIPFGAPTVHLLNCIFKKCGATRLYSQILGGGD